MTGDASTEVLPAPNGTSRRRAARRAGAGAFVAVGTYLAAELAYASHVHGSGVVLLWIPAGLVLGLLLLREPRRWPEIVAGALVGNILADLGHAPSLGAAVAGSAANVIESVVAASLLLRVAGSRLRLDNLRTVVAFLVGAVVASNAVTALLGALVLQLNSWDDLRGAWLVWWAGDGIGMLVGVPLVLAVAGSREALRRGLRLRRVVAFAMLLVAVAGVAEVVLSQQTAPGIALRLTPYMILPVLIWAALRFGPAGAAAAMAVLAAVTVGRLARDPDLFAQAGALRESQVLDAYVFLAISSLTALVPAAVVREREVSAQRLVLSEERYRNLFDSSALGIFRTTPEGRIELANPALIRLLGCASADEASRIDLESRAHDTGYDRTRFREALERDGVVLGMESTWERPDGTVVHVRESARAVRDASGRVVAYEGTIEDVTRAHEAEARLVQSQKLEAVGRLAGGVAHDFNNILTAILGYGELLLARKPLGDPDREWLEQIVRAADRAASLTRQLLTFSRKEVRDPRVLDLNAVVLDVVPMLQRLLGEDVALTARRCETPATVVADPSQMEQILLNLAVNARDAMPRGGRLEIATSVEDLVSGRPTDSVDAGRYVVLCVADTGTGMDARVRARIFEPFFTTKGPGKGTGLGLATVFGIVRQSGGHVGVQSAEGVGTTFRIVLPFAGAPTTTAADDGELAAAPRAAGPETVLLVEDDERVRAYTAEALAVAGYRVVSAGSGSAALDVARATQRIDLLLSDVVMPGMSGPELVLEFRRRGACPRVLLMSGHVDDAVALHGFRAREYAFLQKPFGPDDLARAVRAALDAPVRAAESAVA